MKTRREVEAIIDQCSSYRSGGQDVAKKEVYAWLRQADAAVERAEALQESLTEEIRRSVELQIRVDRLLAQQEQMATVETVTQVVNSTVAAELRSLAATFGDRETAGVLIKRAVAWEKNTGGES